MDFGDSPDEAAFRETLRTWLDERLPLAPVPASDDDRLEYLADWHRQLYDGGWAGVSFPAPWGGRGLPSVYEAIVLDELGRVGAPPPWRFGYVARVIERYGSADQKAQFLQKAVAGEERWCQGFSEPNAGSDLASLRTQAVLRGDHYVVNGQKVWTSEAHWAHWCLLLARTDADAPKHAGMSCFIVRTDTPGLTVRPFRQITGSLEFAELFLDDVEIPIEQMVGKPGEGWRLAMSTVAAERGPADVGFIADFRRTIVELERAAAAGTIELDHDGRMALAEAAIGVEVLRVHVLRSLSRRDAGIGIEEEASVDKLLMTWVEQALSHAVIDALGAAATVGISAGELAGNSELGRLASSSWRDYLWSRAASIYGGTEQIQHSIVATRLLGLPKG